GRRGAGWRPTWRSSVADGSSISRRGAGGGPPRSPRRTGGRWSMGELLVQAWTVARKDLVLEFRTRTALISAVVFTALVLTVFSLGLDATGGSTIDLAPAIRWV